MENRTDFNLQIDGEHIVLLSEFIKENDAENEDHFSKDDLNELKALSLGESMFIGLSEVTRIK